MNTHGHGWIPLLLGLAGGCFAASEAPALRVAARADHRFSVTVEAGGREILKSPEEGLWSIACDWQDGWPAGWVHGGPSAQVRAGEWTLLRGDIRGCGGTWSIEDAYRPQASVIEGRRRFTWHGPGVAPKITLSVRFEARGGKAEALLPGILYYGNPSGARSGRVPVWNGRPGEEAIFEEHRYPMPFAFLELTTPGGLAGAALHTLPSPVAGGNRPDQWWSLGVIGREGGAEVVLLSGPCAANGRRSVIKAFQKTFAPYDDAYVRMEPGAVIEKSFSLEAFPVAREGSGFEQAVRTALELAGSFDASDQPSFAEIVRAKYRYAKSRWLAEAGQAGFRKYADRNPIVMGWTGQAEAPGYALQVLADGIGDPDAMKMARASLDFLSGAEFYEHGFHNWYDPAKRAWYGDELLNQGQALLSFARAIRFGRGHGSETRRWEEFLRKAAEFHANRILSADWKPVSTSDAAFIAPLALAHELFANERYRAAAVRAGDYYAARHLSMREPYWGGTLDAQCEDKEGAAMALQGFLALYELTREAKYLEWARHAADVVLTYVVVWDIDLPPGRLRDHAFRTKGWTSVSPQNQHLDVWGTFAAPDLYKLGQIDGREDLKRLALLMYRACGQLIDSSGSQGEQMQQTNYGQGVMGQTLRGGYNERWTVFWITAHFLTGAAQFAEMGVPVWPGKIVLVGDSTVNDEGGWGPGLRASFGPAVEVVNLARNGRSSKSFRDEGLWRPALDAKPDYVLIQFGHNDGPGKGPERETDPKTTYRANMIRYVEEARAAGAVPVLVTSIVRRAFTADGKIKADSLVPYVEEVRAIAAEKNVPLIDLYELTRAQAEKAGPAGALEIGRKLADGSEDRTHLGTKGQREIGRMAALELVRLAPALRAYLAGK